MRFLLAAILFMVIPNAVWAATYKCDEVDDLARLGYSGSAKVSIVGKDKVCKFSIGDASADGKSPFVDFSQFRNDSELLRLDPSSFMRTRLAHVIRDSAISLGEDAKFVLDDINERTNLANLSCPGETSVGSLSIRCIRFDDARPQNSQVFENGIITAEMFRPRMVFEVKKRGGTMVIFMILR